MRIKSMVVFCSLVLLATSIGSAEFFISEKQTTSVNSAQILLEVINGGFGVSAVIRNIGDVNLTNITWSITCTGGLIIAGKQAEGTLPIIYQQRSATVKIPFFIGFGKTTITAAATAEQASSDELTMQARMRGLRVIIIPGTINALAAKMQLVSRGLISPTVLTNAGDGSHRLFVGEQTGKIYVIENGIRLETPFLDLSGKMVKINPLYDERGLLGLAFHPNYETNGRFFVYYSASKTGAGINHESIIAEYRVSANPNIADAESESIIFRVDQPDMNHNGGQLAFGPEGMLYIALGDGGGAGDQYGTMGNGQDINTSLGSILRIDVDSATPYSIPNDNPFVGSDGLDEIFAFGFRNPYKFSFDIATNRLFVADVGQDTREEINIVENGGNYGWRILEGTYPHDPALAEQLQINLSSLIPPIHEYSHSVGRSIIGGYVYRGSQSPDLVGKYVFGDWSTGFVIPDGKVYYLQETQPDVWERFEFKLEKPLQRFILGFGQGEDGELFVLTSRAMGSFLKSGEIWHITIQEEG